MNLNLKLKSCRHGDMLYVPYDKYIGSAFEFYGEYSQGEVELFDYVSQFGGAALDCGANMGALTVPMALKYEQVFAFEPQVLMYRILRANTAQHLNVTCYNAAVGADDGILNLPRLDYETGNNFGGLGKYVKLGDNLIYDQVQQRKLDKIDALRSCDKIGLMKIDVEGMEREVLEGAQALIDRHRPILYVENDKPSKAPGLVQFIYNLDYKAYWHITSLYNPENFFHNPENIYADIVSFNLICVPNGHRAMVTGAPPCTPENPHLPAGCVTAYD